MPPSDQEPRYRLVDSNGNVVGALWGDGNGNVKIADETDTQTTFGPDGISTPALEADQRNISDLGATAKLSNNQTISDSTNTQVNLDAAQDEDADGVEVDLANNKLIAKLSGSYLVSGAVSMVGTNSWNSGDRVIGFVNIDGERELNTNIIHPGENAGISAPLPAQKVAINNPPTDMTLNVFIDAGQSEDISAANDSTFISATHLG